MKSLRPPSRLARTALVVAIPLVVCGCNLIAGLGDFLPAGGASSGSAGGSGGASGSAGGAPSTVGVGVSSSKAGSSGQTSVTSSTGGGPCATHLIINEVRVQNGDFVELFNPTNAAIPLTGMSVWARTSSNLLGVKWTGLAGDMVPAHAYYLLTTDAADPLKDGTLSALVGDDPTLVVLEDPSTAVVDSLCVCTAASPCTSSGVLSPEYCGARALIAPTFHVANDPYSAQRVYCSDTDVDKVDFSTACPTPHAANLSVASCP